LGLNHPRGHRHPRTLVLGVFRFARSRRRRKHILGISFVYAMEYLYYISEMTPTLHDLEQGKVFLLMGHKSTHLKVPGRKSRGFWKAFQSSHFSIIL